MTSPDLLPTELHGQVVSEVGTAFTRRWPMESSLEKMEAARKACDDLSLLSEENKPNI